MNKEDYVSFEVAQILKEKEYDGQYELCIYESDVEFLDLPKTRTIEKHLVEYFKIKNACPYPFVYDVAKWLREKHDLYIFVEPMFSSDVNDDRLFSFSIMTIKYDEWKYVSTDGNTSFYTYEEALNEGINEALKLI